MNDFGYEIAIASVLSILVAIIEIPWTSKTRLWSSLGTYFWVYLVILIVGNSMTTWVAGAMIPKEWPIPACISGAFLGVFGFQVILKNMNLRVFDKGVLSIEDWISKARDLAVANAVHEHAVSKRQQEIKIAEKLKVDPSLNTYVTQFLGPGTVVELDALAEANGADKNLIKAFALAIQKPEDSAALCKK